jgi:CDP-6-deoxy-D-xylo-4-hexulose-3-dehydrase
MVREAASPAYRERYAREFPDLSPEFIFAVPGFNVRGTEIGAVLGRHQLGRLDENNRRRQHNLELFLAHLDPALYRTDFDLDGSCSYAFNLVLSQPDGVRRDRLEQAMRSAGIEFRRGSSGGGNQLRQPYLRGIVPDGSWSGFPEVEHIHFYGYYIGNNPTLKDADIVALCEHLNSVR